MSRLHRSAEQQARKVSYNKQRLAALTPAQHEERRAKRREYMRSASPEVKAVRAARSKAYRAQPEVAEKLAKDQRRRELRRVYGLTLEMYDELLASQDGCCAICRDFSRGRPLHVDHCHTTGRVRGILCFTCNTALGKFRDSRDLLQKADQYLAKNDGCLTRSSEVL